MAEDILKVLDSVRDSFSGEIDTQNFIDRLLFGDDSAYINDFHSAFKENYFLPVTGKIKDFYSLIKKKLDTVNNTTIDKLTDPFGLSSINKEYEDAIKQYKANMEKFLNKKFESTEEKNPNALNLKQNRAGQYVDQNNRFVSNEVRDQFLAQQAAAKPAENLNRVSQPIQNIIPDSVKNTNPSQALDQEQKNFGPQEILINFSKNGKQFLTELLDNEFKKLPKPSVNVNNVKAEDKNSPTWLLASLILGLISDAILLTKKLGGAFEALIKNPITRLMGILEDEGLYKFADYKAWFELRWEKYIWEPLKSKFPSLEELGTKFEIFGSRIVKFKDSIVQGLKLDDLGAWISLRWEQYIKNPITKVFGEIPKSFEGVTQLGERLLGWVTKFRGPLSYIMEGLEAIARIFTIPVMAAISGIIDGFRTLFSVFGDDKLSFIQKTTAVVTGFFGGVGSLAGDFVKLIGDIISLIPGLHGVGSAIEKIASVMDTHNLGKQAADTMKEVKESGGIVNAGKDVLKGIFSFKEGVQPEDREAYKQLESYKNATPERKKQIDEMQANYYKGLDEKSKTVATQDAEISATEIRGADGKTYIPNKTEDTIIATKSGGSIDKSISNLNKTVASLALAIGKMQTDNNQSQNNVSAVNITANNNSKSSSRDPIHDMRIGHYILSGRGMA